MANNINPTKNTKTTTTSLICTTINYFFLQPISVEEVFHESTNLEREPHKLLASYLKNRQQCTIINKIKSDQYENNYGVPQGSTLGYINDLPNASNLKVILFADNAILTCIDKNPNISQHRTNAELKKIEDWMKTNKLTINYKKTNYMIQNEK